MASQNVENQKGELRQQGAIETAQEASKDPQSKLRPETVEKVLIEETRKAGLPAYQFNPDASPEEKAAAAAARVPPGFHHDKKPKAKAIVTDVDDGTPDQYDLPPPRSASDLIKEEALKPEEDKKEDAEITDDLRWARDRTGWAPQFEKPQTEEEKAEGTLLDHQDFLESKLDDKFFGDWYHNAGVIIFACLASWLVAVLGGGLGWIFIVMAACSTYYRTSIRRLRRNFRDDVNREMAKQRLETDTESLEWINSFLVKFWPIYAPVLCDSIINSVDQVLSTSTPAMLDSLRLKTFILGSKPPRLEHVKTYPKTEVDTVIMDWKFSFTPNDVMDLTARQLKNKINPKVVLEVRVGKGVVSKGLDVIVEDMACSGLMRVKVKLQIPFPHIERVDVCFLERPEIDYVCKPLGGDTLGFDINFIPGLESFIKEQIHGNLEPMMYAPNVFPIEIAKMLAGNPVDQAIGVVAVTLHGARQLKNPDKFAGTPDPYAVVSLNNRIELGRTKTVHDTDSPRWGETIYVIITSFAESLTIIPYDWNEYRKDKELGTATFPLDRLEEQPEHESIYLEVMASGRPRGAIHADIRFFPVLEGRKLENGETEPPPELNTGIARFTVEQAKDLDASKSIVGQLNPYGVLLLNGKEIHITKKLKRTNNPIFQDNSKEFLITDRKSARLGLIIKDDRDLRTDPILGSYQIKLNDMLKMMEKGQNWFHLHGAKTGRAKLTLQWKPVAIGGISGSAGYIDPIGVMRFHFKSATDLRNLEKMGKSDPYVRVLLSGIMKGRTVTFRNNLNPEWDEVVYVPIHSAREKLTLEVMDEESINTDRSLGSFEINASDYVHENENGEFETDDEKQLISSPLRLGHREKGVLNYTVAFYPAVPVVNPEDEEEEEAEEMEGLDVPAARKSIDSRRKSSHSKNPSVDSKASKSSTNGQNGAATNGTTTNGDELKVPNRSGSFSTARDSEAMSVRSIKEVPKTYIGPENISKYESGFFVFKFHEAQLARSNVQLEVLMDDHMFPSYSTPKIRSKAAKLVDVGDAFVRELEFSKITLRLVDKNDAKDDSDEHTVAKLTGDTLPTLQRILYTPTELVLRSNDGEVSKVTVSARYIPVKMKLDPSESINNMGNLRVNVLDAAELPSADRNGFSDPYCKFKLDDKEVFKTKVQKKTLHPAWNEFFEIPIKSRIGAKFRVDVYDWDFGDKADYLGGADINLEMLEPFHSQEVTLTLDGKSGAIRLNLLFKSNYVMRSRQGSSTFSGTFATPGKIVGAPVKGVGFVGGNVIKGASFLKHGIMSRFKGDDSSSDEIPEEPEEVSKTETTQTPSAILVDGATPPSSTPNSLQHARTRSVVSHFGDRLGIGGSAGKGETGTATITVVSASNYPPSSNVRVIIKALGPKGAKEVLKTKAIKASGGGPVQFDASHETCRVHNTTADAQYQVRVVDHSTFGSDSTLGEALFFVDDQGSVAGQEKQVKVGSGVVCIRSSFSQPESSLRPGTAHSNNDASSELMDSPDSKKTGRRSFLSKRSVSGA
ncbi:putative membrane bound C2 domain protein (vp115) [Aspergillus fischeri NRRL 181]|uniref:Membrane bound C2 domain protein (Vp115), putative n=1 Tax=Neosartorya fischeri (strain ATCC 1020 / DSM 3700 / CBS 544.65 / FGSC A1164 / JCM 1740 / NRRL 181 / WB 181) TaxID=331117 RepID=A1D963_NEOFI|nr:membrane bound C2 domain protein (vp115), putative [Aspergillus fischeri NRRL 181]EAW20924.1 membrane bound C2 domain protein (vp115), putative [Aspergillus fischeri NRRL 181]